MAPDLALLNEASGFLQALEGDMGRLESPRDRPRPVLLPTYRGTREQPNLTALLALLLQRYGVPVLLHGKAGSETTSPRVETAASDPVMTVDVLWELGIEPAASRADAQARLLRDGLAYVPVDVIAPGLAEFVATRAQSPGSAPLAMVAALVEPFGSDGFRVLGAADEEGVALLRAWLTATRGDALLLCGAEGEPFANPRRQPRVEHVVRGVASICVEAETADVRSALSLPSDVGATTTAAWITQALAGSVPLPPPIVTQLGCCLNGARRPSAANGVLSG